MKARWLVGGLGGALAALVWGAFASSLVPGLVSGPPLSGIALGLMVTVIAWAGLWVGAMGTPRLGRYGLTLLLTSLCLLGVTLWRMME